jgi:hypothetical protein
MKSLGIMALIVLLLSLSVQVHAQYARDKDKYNTRQYSYRKGDPYHPLLAGLASYVVPGLGQLVCNETNRGLRFMGAWSGSLLVATTGVAMFANNPSSRTGDAGVAIMIAGALSAYGIQIWSVVDAVKVAKINNMAWREKSKHTGTIMQLMPYVESSAPGAVWQPGITLRMRF